MRMLSFQASSIEAETWVVKMNTHGMDVAMDHVVSVEVLDCLGCLDELQMSFNLVLRFTKVGLTSLKRGTSGNRVQKRRISWFP